MKDRVIVIVGPTATGKSSLGLKLAQKLGARIISGDSVLVYKKLNIGSAKPSPQELEQVRHEMVDILEPEDNFDVLTFKGMVQEQVQRINAQGQIPILVGGTGLYIKAVLEDYSFLPVEENPLLRTELESFAQTYGNAALHERLRSVDYAAADRLHPNDKFRVIRAIEIATAGGNKAEIKAERGLRTDWEIVVYGLQMDREKLYERINARVDTMLAGGLVEEVRTLLADGVPPQAQSMHSIGYKQVVEYLNGSCDYPNCVDKIKQATRNFAKRQITWFKAMPYINWLEIEETTDLDYLANKLAAEVRQNENQMA